jgi:hypothetical protein
VSPALATDVAILERCDDRPPRILPLSDAEAFTELLAHRIQASSSFAEGTITVAQLVRGALCYRIRYSSHHDLQLLLREHIARQASSSSRVSAGVVD